MNKKKLIMAMALVLSISTGYTSVFANTNVNAETTSIETTTTNTIGKNGLYLDTSRRYIIYDGTTDNALFDDGGQNMGWIKKGKYNESNASYAWVFEKANDGYYLKSAGKSWYLKGAGHSLNELSYVGSDKKSEGDKGEYVFVKKDKGFVMQSVSSGEYLTYGKDEGYVTFTSNINEAKVWSVQLEPEYAKPEGSLTLWENPQGNNYNRIPAITTTNDGTLLAINDLRYNHAGDLGNHRIDLLLKSSSNNGETWSDEINLTEKYTKNATEESYAYGYGDAAIVSDRDSDNILILAASGTPNFWHGDKKFVSTRENPVNVGKITSEDGGKTFKVEDNLTDEIYGLNKNWTRLFAASGRIMQSRYIKVGEYARIYTAVLVGNGDKNAGNYVLYSDDFGDTWNVLGDGTSPVPAGDEAKIEELPNGNVVISSRTGSGRLINIFTYDEKDNSYSKGSWEDTSKKLSLGNGSSCNGEVMVVYVKDKETGEYTHLALQSLPTLGGSRKGVGIYFKELDSNTKTVDEYIEGWSEENFYMIQEKESAYSTMTLQEDGSIAFLYEDRLRSGYDGQFLSLDIETITNNKYEIAFEGLGTKEVPYEIETVDQFKASQTIYGDDISNWAFDIDN